MEKKILFLILVVSPLEITPNIGLTLTPKENVYIRQGAEASISVHSPIEINVSGDGENKESADIIDSYRDFFDWFLNV